MSDWSFLSFELAKRGIGCDVEEIITDDYEPDPWRPPPDTEAVAVTLDLAGASKLVGILEDTEATIELTDDEQATLDRALDRMENFGITTEDDDA